MARLLVLVVLVLSVDAYNRHPKFPKLVASDDAQVQSVIKRAACNSAHDRKRNDLIMKSRCGEPKEVFEKLSVSGSYLKVTPSHVWVKRCVGLCDYDAAGSRCTPTRIRKELIPVRIYNSKTNKETCSTYEMDVHESCGCCLGEGECAAPKVFNPRKCSCQCPNMDDRRNCYKQRHMNMRWNRSKCACEPRRRATTW